MTLIKLLPAVSQLSASARIKMFGLSPKYLRILHLTSYLKIMAFPIQLSAIWDYSQAKRRRIF